jgi:UTP--glucose-1-phosphate uridylyltransferase
LANIISIRQKQALGLGHAVLTGKPVIGEEPFAVLLGDEIMVTEAAAPTVIGQLCDSYSESGLSTVAVMEVAPEEVHKYGIIAYSEHTDSLYHVTDVLEKPSLEKAPSRLALPGRYVFDSALFGFLKNISPGKNGEIQLTDGMVQLAKKQGLRAKHFVGTRYDAGDKLGYVIANFEMALRHPEIGSAFQQYLDGKTNPVKKML